MNASRFEGSSLASASAVRPAKSPKGTRTAGSGRFGPCLQPTGEAGNAPGGAPGGAAIWTTPGRSARIFSVGPCNFFIRMKSWMFLLSGKGTGVALGLLLWLAPGRAAAEPSCGVPGKPACPFQSFMRTRLATALAHRDFRELERRLAEVAERNPEPRKWQNWNKFARDGAEAAREGRLRGVIAACSRCHAIYRPEFNARFRERPVPER